MLIKPMLAKTARKPFSSPEWIFEVKWDGIRAIAYVEDSLSVKSRRGNELLHAFPELSELKELVRGKAILDGEVVVLRGGRPDFQLAIERLNAPEERISYLARRFPASYVVFDILRLNGEWLLRKPLVERKRILAETLKEGRHAVIADFVEERGEEYFQAVLKLGLEGVVAKRKTSAYEPGKRSDNWLKIKRTKSVDCIIVGFTRGKGERGESFGALLLALYDGEALRYVGKVGTGFDRATLRSLREELEKLRAGALELRGYGGVKGASFVRPELVAEIAYDSVTSDLKLRMPRFVRLRRDKPAEECTVEQLF
ncbi:MAG: DNA ligase [Euryarchaeota archaeon]|nr:DNA ligase [Euryarchaeota archaeon]